MTRLNDEPEQWGVSHYLLALLVAAGMVVWAWIGVVVYVAVFS